MTAIDKTKESRRNDSKCAIRHEILSIPKRNRNSMFYTERKFDPFVQALACRRSSIRHRSAEDIGFLRIRILVRMDKR